jgi:hypothetical protein
VNERCECQSPYDSDAALIEMNSALIVPMYFPTDEPAPIKFLQHKALIAAFPCKLQGNAHSNGQS